MKKLMTITEIAQHLNCKDYQVGYIIRTRNIRPRQLAGRVRLFTPFDLESICVERLRDRRRKDYANKVLPGKENEK